MSIKAHLLAWLLLVVVAFSATPWEGLAASSGVASAAAVVRAHLPAAAGGEGGGQPDCCVCLCSFSPSQLFPAGSPSSIAVHSPGPAVMLPCIPSILALHSRLVFRPPRPA